MDHLFELFPTPVMRVDQLLDAPLIAKLTAKLVADGATRNDRSTALLHSAIQRPDAQSGQLLAEVAALVTPKLVDFGVHLFGERLDWRIKEMWTNVLGRGGFQAMHNHANCFISGVIYLSASHASANTVFMKGPGGNGYAFSNAGPHVAQGPFNADKWISPDVTPGDMVLFPSYLLHEVPPNAGDERITLAFNAIPARLDSWGYALGFAP
jgi:uncharacterized protein (TIGR02466 family)